MAKDESKRVSRTTLADDETAFNALQKIDGYAPANANYAVTALTQAFARMQDLQAAEDQAAAALATARDAAASQEWAFHNLMLGAKDSVRAQFGKDSTQVQELGLKRASDYRSRGPKSKAAPK
ncbi:MAG TPA: hypothetical protein VKA60_08715 [Blastocatellia bacterium]|nr:hypothetical protein [Blastocatellia bacterium]